MPKSRGAWIAIAVFASAIVVLGFWALLISPNRGAAAEHDAAREKVAAENAVLEKKVSALRAEFAKIDDYRAELEGLRVHLPTTLLDENTFDRITQIASDNDVLILGQKPGTPVSLVGQIQAAAIAEAEAEAETKEAADGADAAATPPPPPAGWAAATVDQLAAVPVELELEGTYEGVRGMLRELRGTPDRYVLLAAPSLDLEKKETEDPAVRATVTVYTFSFTDTAEQIATELLVRQGIIERGLDMPTSSDDPFGLRDGE